MMTNNILRSVALLSFLALFACGMQQASTDQVKRLADKYWHEMQQGNIDEALKYYGKSFFEVEPESVWRARLAEVGAKLGKLKKWELRDAEINTMYSGRQYMFKFVNAYEKGNATETVIFFQPVDDPAIFIAAHKIESMAL